MLINQSQRIKRARPRVARQRARGATLAAVVPLLAGASAAAASFGDVPDPDHRRPRGPPRRPRGHPARPSPPMRDFGGRRNTDGVGRPTKTAAEARL